ncbi:LacI family DNA-binding transcriptional regulator [Alteromonas gracilis]|uniref:LacI family transcriptional regulator n=1 Tax=Alteromonas gracilis TaxID=1479524 RepID=A0ABX5CW10_9ALTE|nr:LacI family DNA-binding transcriptional regulator [Alteromonas gracilis]PRO70755.1 LacI family transcriptional regulator [Alteromonas gracilis]
MKKPTIKDVAKLAGVSFKTVSRVVNQEPNVSEAVKEKVLESIKQLNYQPNHTARVMRKAPFSLAFVYDNPNSHYVIEMQNGIISECRKKGFELVIHPTDSRSDEVGNELASMIGSNQIGGIILTPPLSENKELVTFLLSKDAKVVRILSGEQPPDSLAPVLHVDDVDAGFKMTQYLLELGHRDIAFLGFHASHESSLGRVKGFKNAHEARNVPFDKNLIIDGEFTFESGMDMAKQVLSMPKRPTAIFACNDEIAAGAVFCARLNDITVPEELSVVGFENSPFAMQTWPHLTTIDQPNFDIAATAAAMVIEMMKSNDIYTVDSRGFSLDVVVRDSACKPLLKSAI